ncbi:MAG: GTPase [bacterium]
MNTDHLRENLTAIRLAVSVLHERLVLQTDIEIDTFSRVLDTKFLLPLDPDYPLMVAITGSGSSGKSSLFNALLSSNISVVKAKAGLSRRVLVGIHPNILKRKDILENLFEAFGAAPQPLGSQNELTKPGEPKYVANDDVPPHLVLLDTPDFDTGDQYDFANRNYAKPVLEASDVLIYIFTNANYNNRQNTVFIRNVTRDIGRRKLLLVYRCSRAFSEDEVIEHATVVARNIYDDNYQQWLLGVYRADEEDRVALGEEFMNIRPVGSYSDIQKVLKSLDRVQTRHEFMSSALLDIYRDAEETLRAAKIERIRIEIYRDVVRIATSWAVADALKAFPQRMLLELFLKIWNKQQPGYIKVLKFAGKVTAWPAEKVLQIIRKNKSKTADTIEITDDSSDMQYRNSLISAANTLLNRLSSKEITVQTTTSDDVTTDLIRKIDLLQSMSSVKNINLPHYEKTDKKLFTFFVPRPEPYLLLEKAREKKELWEDILQNMTDTILSSTGLSEEFTDQLKRIARDFRSNMTYGQVFRELATASLTTFPAVSAVTYIFLTGDPVVGAPNIFAALSGLFGLNDLIATVSIPAALGLNELDRKNLESLLAKVYQAWFKEKEDAIESNMLHHVSGRIIDSIDAILNQTTKPVDELSSALDNLKKEDQI